MNASQALRGAFLRGSASALALRLLGAGLAFGLQVLLARLLGHAQYGVYIFAFTSIATLSLVLKLGLDTATLHFVPGYRSGGQWDLLRGFLRESGRFVRRTAGGASVAVAGAALLLRTEGDPVLAWCFVAAAAGLPVLTAQHLAEARLRAFGRIALSRVPPELLQPLFVGLLVLAFVAARGAIGAVPAMACTVVASGATLLCSALAFRRAAPAEAFSGPRRRDPGAWFAASRHLALYATTMLVIGQVDVIVTGALLGPEAAGAYATASRVSKFVPFGITAVNLSLMPLVSRLHHEGRTAELQRNVLWAAAAIVAITLPLGVAAVGFGRSLLGLFGPEFVSAYPALVVLTVGRMVNAFCGPTGTLLTMTGSQRDAAVVAVGSALLDGALLVLLVPVFGIVGAAVATAATIAAWNLAQVALVHRRTGIHPTVFALLRARPSDRPG